MASFSEQLIAAREAMRAAPPVTRRASAKCLPCREKMLAVARAAAVPACSRRSPPLAANRYLCGRDDPPAKVSAQDCRRCGGPFGKETR